MKNMPELLTGLCNELKGYYPREGILGSGIDYFLKDNKNSSTLRYAIPFTKVEILRNRYAKGKGYQYTISDPLIKKEIKLIVNQDGTIETSFGIYRYKGDYNLLIPYDEVVLNYKDIILLEEEYLKMIKKEFHKVEEWLLKDSDGETVIKVIANAIYKTANPNTYIPLTNKQVKDLLIPETYTKKFKEGFLSSLDIDFLDFTTMKEYYILKTRCLDYSFGGTPIPVLDVCLHKDKVEVKIGKESEWYAEGKYKIGDTMQKANLRSIYPIKNFPEGLNYQILEDKVNLRKSSR